jgi:hypothetical protein
MTSHAIGRSPKAIPCRYSATSSGTAGAGVISSPQIDLPDAAKAADYRA